MIFHLPMVCVCLNFFFFATSKTYHCPCAYSFPSRINLKSRFALVYVMFNCWPRWAMRKIKNRSLLSSLGGWLCSQSQYVMRYIYIDRYPIERRVRTHGLLLVTFNQCALNFDQNSLSSLSTCIDIAMSFALNIIRHCPRNSIDIQLRCMLQHYMKCAYVPSYS